MRIINKRLKGIWIIAAMAPVLIAVVLVFGYQANKTAEKVAFEELNRRQLVLAREAASGIELYFEHLAAELKMLIKILGTRFSDVTPIRRELRLIFAELEHWGVNDIGVLDSNGVLKYNVMAPQLEGTDFSWRRYYREAKEMTSGNSFIIEFKGAEAGQKGILLAVPIFRASTEEKYLDRPGKFVGVALCTLKLDTLTQRFVASIKSSDRGQAFLIEGFPNFQQIVEKMGAGDSGKTEHSFYEYEHSQGRYTRDIEEKLIAYAPMHI